VVWPEPALVRIARAARGRIDAWMRSQSCVRYLENGESLDEFLEGFPTVSRDLAVQVLEECKELRLARV
jgi:hypothetical protein